MLVKPTLKEDEYLLMRIGHDQSDSILIFEGDGILLFD
jgi:hypothetical protein